MLVNNPIENLLLWAAIFYFVPSLIALIRGNNFASIFAVNLFLGWSLVGWVVALAWALSARTNNTQQSLSNNRASKVAQTNRVLTTITPVDMQTRQHWGNLSKSQPILLKREKDERWAVLSEGGVLGYLDNDASRVVSFRSEAIGKPRGKIIRVDPDMVDLEITFPQNV
jgi:hypothetical protein